MGRARLNMVAVETRAEAKRTIRIYSIISVSNIITLGLFVWSQYTGHRDWKVFTAILVVVVSVINFKLSKRLTLARDLLKALDAEDSAKTN